MYDDKTAKAKKYLQMAMDCLSEDSHDEGEEVSEDKSSKSDSSDDDMDAGRSVLRQRLGKLA